MREFTTMWQDLRTVFTIVPWRVRPRLIQIASGSVAIALIDMVAVVLMLPVMQLVSGTPVADSAILTILSDVLRVSSPDTLLLATLIIVAALMITKSLLTLAFRWWSVGVINRAQTDATGVLMDLFMTSPFEAHRKRATGDIFTSLNGYIPSAFGAVTLGLIQIIVDGTLVIAIMIALFVLSPIATLLALTFFGLTAIAIQAVLKNRLIQLGDKMRLAGLRGWSYLTPAIDGFKQARLSEAGATLSRRFIETKVEQNELGRRASLLNELPRHLLEVMMVVGIALLSVILFATSAPGTAFSILGVFAVASIRMVPSLNRLIATVGAIRANVSNLDALARQIDELRAESFRDDYDELPIRFPNEDIAFTDLTFRFQDGEEPVLDRVSGVIPRGSIVALVGSSGAGKTTFVDLLTAMFQPTSGRITVGGLSIHDHPMSWRRQIGVVPQHVFLWAESIRRNIAYAIPDEEIDEDRVRAAVRMAQLDDVISEMPEGLDTPIGYQGARLSGGQQQRIGIARALYRDLQLLILDEATSALDNVTESKLTRTIESLHGSMTIIVVAHRLSTVKNADMILFFSQGKIVDRGTMSELAARNEDFAELIRLGRLV
ncbi:MAG TPA: ABC transporter ATP-binding protein [Arachnia sp.]|nr:ABC transporter ATP-binding protein [Arachnia sp.]